MSGEVNQHQVQVEQMISTIHALSEQQQNQLEQTKALRDLLDDRRKKAWVGPAATVATVLIAVLGLLDAFKSSIENFSDLKEENRMNQLRVILNEERDRQRPVDEQQNDDIKALRFDVDSHAKWIKRLGGGEHP